MFFVFEGFYLFQVSNLTYIYTISWHKINKSKLKFHKNYFTKVIIVKFRSKVTKQNLSYLMAQFAHCNGRY